MPGHRTTAVSAPMIAIAVAAVLWTAVIVLAGVAHRVMPMLIVLLGMAIVASVAAIAAISVDAINHRRAAADRDEGYKQALRDVFGASGDSDNEPPEPETPKPGRHLALVRNTSAGAAILGILGAVAAWIRRALRAQPIAAAATVTAVSVASAALALSSVWPTHPARPSLPVALPPAPARSAMPAPDPATVAPSQQPHGGGALPVHNADADAGTVPARTAPPATTAPAPRDGGAAPPPTTQSPGPIVPTGPPPAGAPTGSCLQVLTVSVCIGL